MHVDETQEGKYECERLFHIISTLDELDRFVAHDEGPIEAY